MMMTTPSMSQRRAVTAAKHIHPCWTSAFTQGQRPLKTREQRTVFPEPQTDFTGHSLFDSDVDMDDYTDHEQCKRRPASLTLLLELPLPGASPVSQAEIHRAGRRSSCLAQFSQANWRRAALFLFCTNKTQNHSYGSI